MSIVPVSALSAPIVPVYDIRGHHLVDITYFLHEPEKTSQDYRDKGYGEEFVENQRRVFTEFMEGRAKIKITAGELDVTCRASCQRKPRIDQNKGDFPCENHPVATECDRKAAAFFLLKVGETYTFAEIEKNLRNFYYDQHSM